MTVRNHLACAVVCFLVYGLVAAPAPAATVRLPVGKVRALQHGTIRLRSAVKAAGHRLVDDKAAPVDFTFSVGVAKPDAPAETVPMGDGSFVIRGDEHGIGIVGRDAAGAMYACLELADAVAFGSKLRDLAAERASARPFHTVRGIELLLDRSALEGRSGWFRDVTFWQKYLDLLARCRFNWIELHAGYDDATGEFFDAFNLFFEVGNPNASPNTDALRRAVRMAQRRGIRVVFFVRGIDPENTDLPDKLAFLLEACPGIDGVGFEAVQTGGAALLRTAGDRLIVLTARQGDRSDLARLDGRLRVKAPFSGDALGLPYPVPLNDCRPHQSYRDLTGLPRNYSLTWRIPCASTNRVFSFADSDFIRRAVRACRFGDADGFILQPPAAWTPPGRRIDKEHDTRGWAFRRRAETYRLWGRLGYDPTFKPDAHYDRLAGAIGREPYRLIHRARQTAGRLLTTLLAAHCPGLDRHEVAPELLLGGDSLAEYAAVGPLDATTTMSIKEAVRNRIAGVPFVRTSPWEIASKLIEQAHEAGEECRLARVALPRTADRADLEMFECARADVAAVAELAAYHGRMTLGALDYELFQQTGDYERLQTARGNLHLALRRWRSFARLVDVHYGPFAVAIESGDEPTVMKARNFTWAAEGRKLADSLEELVVETDNAEAPVIGHVPVRRFAANGRFTLSATVRCGSDATVKAWYRRRGEGVFKSIPMTKERKFRYVASEAIAAGPVAVDNGGEDIEYYIEAAEDGTTTTLPEAAPVKVFTVNVFGENTPPVISHDPAVPPAKADRMSIEARIADSAKITSARVWFKPLPQGARWLSASLTKGADGVWRGAVPLTHEGLMYYITAIDVNGNGARAPGSRKPMPYWVIPARPSVQKPPEPPPDEPQPPPAQPDIPPAEPEPPPEKEPEDNPPRGDFDVPPAPPEVLDVYE